MGEVVRRTLGGPVETTMDTVADALRPLVADDAGAKAVASAFYDVAWVPLASNATAYEEAWGKPGTLVMSWRNAGGFVADLRGRGESYLDWAYEAEAGVVDPRVLAIMESLGLRPVT